MKYGIRKPSIKKSISARTTGKLKREIKRSVNPLYGKKGMGVIHDPKKAAYNAVYHRTTVGVSDIVRASDSFNSNKVIKTGKGIKETQPKKSNKSVATNYDKYSAKTYKVCGTIAIICGSIGVLFGLLLLFADAIVAGIGAVIFSVLFIAIGKKYKKIAKGKNNKSYEEQAGYGHNSLKQS